MTLAAIVAPMAWRPLIPGGYAISTSLGSDVTFTFNGAGDKMAVVFQAPSTTPPDQVKFRCQAYTSTGTIDATLETVDATTGFPSGTPVTNSGTGSVSVASTGTKTCTGLAGTASLTAGTQYAVVLTATGGFAGNFNVLRTTGINGGIGSPYSLTKDSAGAWTKAYTTNAGFAFGLMTSGGVSINVPGLAGAYTAAYTAWTDATNPDERGNRFSFPGPVTCYGAEVHMSLGSVPADAQSGVLSLYSTHTGTPSQIASFTIDGDMQDTGPVRFLRFSTPVDLAANTVYALVLKATAAGNLTVIQHTYASAAELGCYLDDNFYSTTRNNSSGAFTDGNTTVYAVYPIVSKIDDGASAGGGLIRHPGMNGGLNG